MPYIIENLRIRSRWNKRNCKPFGAKSTSSSNLLEAARNLRNDNVKEIISDKWS